AFDVVVAATPTDRVTPTTTLDPIPAVGPDDDVVAGRPAQNAAVPLAIVRAADDPAVLHVDRRGRPDARRGSIVRARRRERTEDRQKRQGRDADPCLEAARLGGHLHGASSYAARIHFAQERPRR